MVQTAGNFASKQAIIHVQSHTLHACNMGNISGKLMAG